MMLFLFLGFIGMCSLLALRSWRWGLVAAILVGLLQDPVRKVLPGTPALLTLSTVPVWLALAANVLSNQRSVVSRFMQDFPVLARRLSWFGVYLVIPALISVTYGRGSWQITLLGAFVFGAGFALVLAGWAGVLHARQLDQFLALYALIAGALLLGGVLEYVGWGTHLPVIGSAAMGHIWVTHRTGDAVYMLAGFFRGPDVMGWHAIMVFMFAFILAMRSRGAWRVFWIAVAVWGVLGLWVCGRRKMIAMAPVFVGTYLLVVFRVRKARRVFSLLALAVLVAGVGFHMVGRVYQDNPTSRFYMTLFDEWDDQIMRHGVYAVIGTVQQAGWLGYGLGMSQQGVHNINAEKPHIWQESGPSKVVAELGVPGAILFLLLGYALFRTAYEIVRLHADQETVFLFAGLFALFVANLASSVVSAQIYGDPFVVLFLAFLAGTLLSGARMQVGDGMREES